MGKRTEVDEEGAIRTFWGSDVADNLLSDPLTSTSREHRRNLIATSGLGVVVAITGIVPKNILGVELSGVNQSTLIWSLVALIVYQWIAFSVYAGVERMSHQGKLRRTGYKPDGIGDMPLAAFPASLRNLLDFTFPNIIATISILLLVWLAIGSTNSPKDSEWLGIITRCLVVIASISVIINAFSQAVRNLMSIRAGTYNPKDPTASLDDIEA